MNSIVWNNREPVNLPNTVRATLFSKYTMSTFICIFNAAFGVVTLFLQSQNMSSLNIICPEKCAQGEQAWVNISCFLLQTYCHSPEAYTQTLVSSESIILFQPSLLQLTWAAQNQWWQSLSRTIFPHQCGIGCLAGSCSDILPISWQGKEYVGFVIPLSTDKKHIQYNVYWFKNIV